MMRFSAAVLFAASTLDTESAGMTGSASFVRNFGGGTGNFAFIAVGAPAAFGTLPKSWLRVLNIDRAHSCASVVLWIVKPTISAKASNDRFLKNGVISLQLSTGELSQAASVSYACNFSLASDDWILYPSALSLKMGTLRSV